MVNRKVIGLDIGSSSFRVIEAELFKDGSLKTINTAYQVKIPTQVVSNGTVVSAEAFTEKLTALIQSSGVKTKNVYITVNGKSVFTRSLKRVEREKDEAIFLKTLPFKIDSSLPITMSENHLGYHVTNEYVDADARRILRDILVVTVTKENLDTILQGVKEVKLHPSVVDIAPLGLIRASHADESLKGKRIACVDVGGDVTTIAIHKNGYPEYIRIILDKGGKRIDRRISDELKIPASEAEAEKFNALGRKNIIEQKSTSIFGGDVKGIKADSREAYIANAINLITAQELTSLLTEIRDTFTDAETFHGSTVDTPIEAIVLSGAGAGLQTLAARIQNELGVPVTYSNVLEQYASKELKEKIEKGEVIPHEFATVAGLVFRNEKYVKAEKVVTEKVKTEKKKKTEKNGK